MAGSQANRLPGSTCNIPSRLSVFHPSYLPSSLRARIRKGFNPRRIFLNIPYATRYTKFELAIIATATAYGLDPVMAKQRAVFDVRFKRILEMICSCAVGVTDLSYAHRMNMPLELGIMLALGKNCFIVSRRRYSGLASISDLNLGDIRYHEGDPKALIRDFSRWIEANCSPKKMTIAELLERYEAFVELRKALGADDFDRLSPQDISQMLRIAGATMNIRLAGRA